MRCVQASLFLYERCASIALASLPMRMTRTLTAVLLSSVYAPDMPMRLPFLLLARRFAQQTGQGLLFALRAVMVGLIWLAILPWATIWTWRMYFTMGDSTCVVFLSSLPCTLTDGHQRVVD